MKITLDAMSLEDCYRAVAHDVLLKSERLGINVQAKCQGREKALIAAKQIQDNMKVMKAYLDSGEGTMSTIFPLLQASFKIYTMVEGLDENLGKDGYWNKKDFF